MKNIIIMISILSISCGQKEEESTSTSTSTTTPSTSNNNRCGSSTTNNNIILTQPDLPSDWKVRSQSWPIEYWSYQKNKCRETVLDYYSECGIIKNELTIKYAEESCICLVVGAYSNTYYPNEPADSIFIKWSSYCADKTARELGIL